MTVQFCDIDAITIDFYNTLVYHREGSGRGAMLMQYLGEQGFESDPWEHQVLYDVFANHAEDYAPNLTAEAKRRFLVRFAKRVFERLQVRAPDSAAADHATNIWAILGPASLGVFPDVSEVLELLRGAGYRLALVSNWQCGLSHFCVELGLADAFDHIIVSAEVGSAKPDSMIFQIACRRLGVQCHRVLHVGDSIVDDIEGARSAGMPALLVRRDGAVTSADTPVIAGLDQLPDLLGVRGGQ